MTSQEEKLNCPICEKMVIAEWGDFASCDMCGTHYVPRCPNCEEILDDE